MQSKTNLVEKDDWIVPIGAMGYKVHSTLSDFGSETAFLKAYKQEGKKKKKIKISITTLESGT